MTKADINEYSRESGTSLDTAYATLNSELELPTPSRQPREFIPRFLDELSIGDSEYVQRRAMELAQRASEAGICIGQNPRGVAAACLYQSLQEIDACVIQADLATIAGVSEVTIRKQWYALQDGAGRVA